MKKALFLFILLANVLFSCSKNTNSNNSNLANHSPVVALSASLTNASPLTFTFMAVAIDQDSDPLTYKWDFGEGTSKDGKDTISFVYHTGDNYTVKVSVTDGKSAPVAATVDVDTKLIVITKDNTKAYQYIDGFGGFGAQDVYYENGPYTSTDFVNSIVNDLGITILRDEVPTNFEYTNDNDDPFVTDLTKYNLATNADGNTAPLGLRIPYFKSLKEAGIEKFIATVWSPPLWMKYNNKLGNGTVDKNSAPDYTTSPTNTTNQLRTDMYDEFSEMCLAFTKIFKQQVGIDLYALSIQNEPRFSQFYQSCVYNGNALRDLLKVVGKRFKDEGVTTKLFLPEDVGWLQGIQSMITPVLDDANARQYADIVAVHGYDLDGVTAASQTAQNWQTTYSWGAAYNKPLWMTETSGFANTMQGALDLGKAMYTALKFGNVSAWVFWSLSTKTLDSYSLMSSSGQKSKRYYTSKNFYRYVRPGAQRIDIEAGDESKILPLAFNNQAESSNTIVLINDDAKSSKAVRLAGSGLSSQYNFYITSADEDCKDHGSINLADALLIPANSVVTLYHKD